MKERPIVRRGFFFCRTECEEQSLEYYRDYFWKVLQYLHENDKETWPKQIAKDPDHYLWEFSFGGEPIFAFGNAPAYKQRKTRHLGNSLVIGFQPRTIFDGLEGIVLKEHILGKRSVSELKSGISCRNILTLVIMVTRIIVNGNNTL